LVAIESDGTINIRKLLLDFYSSELTTHSRLIIGFSVILFTILQIFQKLDSEVLPLSTSQKSIASFSTWLISAALWYLLMRHVSYGILSNSVLHAEIGAHATLVEALVMVRNHALEHTRVFMVLPPCLFIPSSARVTRLQKLVGRQLVLVLGLLVCVVLGIATTLLFSVLVGLW
jgi:hypothetical protein